MENLQPIFNQSTDHGGSQKTFTSISGRTVTDRAVPLKKQIQTPQKTIGKPTVSAPKRYLDMQGAADLFGVSTRTVRRWMDDPNSGIPTFSIPGYGEKGTKPMIRFELNQISQWFEKKFSR